MEFLCNDRVRIQFITTSLALEVVKDDSGIKYVYKIYEKEGKLKMKPYG